MAWNHKEWSFQRFRGRNLGMIENYLSHLEDPESGIFRNYRYNPNESIREQIRPVIVEEKSGNFWVGTSSGLFYFDRTSESFQRFQHNPADPTSLSHNLVKSILPDPKHPDRFL